MDEGQLTQQAPDVSERYTALSRPDPTPRALPFQNAVAAMAIVRLGEFKVAQSVTTRAMVELTHFGDLGPA